MPSAAKPAGRPALLWPLFAPLSSLPGVGPVLAQKLGQLLGTANPRSLDLVFHLPRGHLDTVPLEDLKSAEEGQFATLLVEIRGHAKPRIKRVPWRIRGFAAGADIDLVFFNAYGNGLEQRFAVGSMLALHGRLSRYRERWQMAHPDILPGGMAGQSRGLALYPAIAGLGQGTIRRTLSSALERLPDLPEWLPEDVLAGRRWPAWAEALRLVHGEGVEGAVGGDDVQQARRRLAFDELLAHQLALALVRRQMARTPGRSILGNGRLRVGFLDRLAFTPTGDQERAVQGILDDMAASRPMARLLQGDVGSGKTLVAFQAMLAAVEAGVQAVMMAPTELLARQHHATLSAWAAALDLPVGFLAGGERGRARIFEGLAEGTLPLAVGTHALFQEGVVFKNLGLVVVDEQHRFGVHQRLALLGKGEAVDLLLMTATPIPRSLVLTLYGDLPVSVLREKPPGRQSIETRALPASRLAEVVEACGRALETGARIYWICPQIEPDGSDETAAAESRFAFLEQRFGERVGLAHGRMKPAERERVMRAFSDGRVQLLVATTVVEVGVDVPEATVMVIERANRFGLSQLHQLRGRVGRGTGASVCLALYERAMGSMAKERLRIFRKSDDGFAIAEADLRLRGPGEVLGTRQSGLPDYKLADLAEDQDLLGPARDIAAMLLKEDFGAARDEAAPARLLLHLFDRQEALALLAAG